MEGGGRRQREAQCNHREIRATGQPRETHQMHLDQRLSVNFRRLKSTAAHDYNGGDTAPHHPPPCAHWGSVCIVRGHGATTALISCDFVLVGASAVVGLHTALP